MQLGRFGDQALAHYRSELLEDTSFHRSLSDTCRAVRHRGQTRTGLDFTTKPLIFGPLNDEQ
jgi:hypothetical protein